MYNRYTPQPDGSYRRSREGMPGQSRRTQRSQEAPKSSPQASASAAPPPRQPDPLPEVLQNLVPSGLDMQDLLVILLVLLLCGDSAEGRGRALLTIALYFAL